MGVYIYIYIYIVRTTLFADIILVTAPQLDHTLIFHARVHILKGSIIGIIGRIKIGFGTITGFGTLFIPRHTKITIPGRPTTGNYLISV